MLRVDSIRERLNALSLRGAACDTAGGLDAVRMSTKHSA